MLSAQLAELAGRRPLRALGLMSGTSVDGVDVALIETDGEAVVSRGPALTVPYDQRVRGLIRSVFGAEKPSEATGAAERALTEAHADAVRQWSHHGRIAL